MSAPGTAPRPGRRRRRAGILALALAAALALPSTIAAQSTDPNIPDIIPLEDLTDFPNMIDRFLADIVTPGTPPMLATGERLLELLATIIIVWTGLRIAYSGTFQPWEAVRLVIGIGIPWTMLAFYDRPFIPSGHNFPMAISAGANWISTQFTVTTVQDILAQVQEVGRDLAGRMMEAARGGNIFGVITTGISGIITQLGLFFIAPFLLICVVLVFAISYAQVIWATIAISLLIFLGPLFIPFLVFQPLSFLFWGWFKSLIMYSLYSAIAAALLRVFGGISMGLMGALSNDLNSLQNLGDLVVWTLSVLPITVAALLASLKIGDIASGIVNSGGDGGGLFGAIGTAALAAGAAGRVARVAVPVAGGR